MALLPKGNFFEYSISWADCLGLEETVETCKEGNCLLLELVYCCQLMMDNVTKCSGKKNIYTYLDIGYCYKVV